MVGSSIVDDVKVGKNFFKWSDAYPFYKNVKTEGTLLYETA